MFIRWQKRALASRSWYRSDSSISWRAVLVEAVRVDGRPVPRHIGYVGSIGDEEIKDPQKRLWFWERVLQKLDEVQVPTGLRAKLIAALARKVPRE